ncbi:MAG TPA: TadE/TadG family type IV pilus assembly protein [Terriglobales bacterium]|jgi:Flp pilus assembly protein TadG
MRFRWAKRLFKETAGQEIAEAAVVLPILFLLLIGIYWFGRAYNIYSTMNHAAREGARAAIVSTCASCTASAITADQVAATVTQALQASHINTASIQTYSPSAMIPCPGVIASNACTTTASNVTVCQGIELNSTEVAGSGAQPVCGVSVSFQYPYNFSIPFTSVSQIQIKADVQMQEEN